MYRSRRNTVEAGRRSGRTTGLSEFLHVASVEIREMNRREVGQVVDRVRSWTRRVSAKSGVATRSLVDGREHQAQSIFLH